MAKAKRNTGLYVGILLVVMLLAGAFYFVGQSAIGEKVLNTPQSCADSTGILTVNSINALQQSSAVATPTITAGIGDGPLVTSVTSGTTSFAVGSKINVLVSKAGYIDKAFSFTMPCGGEVLDAPLYAASATNPEVKIKNDDGDFMTNSITGGAVNQTALSAGETLNLDVQFQGVSLENSGDLIYVVELPASTSANVTSITMPGLTSVPVPSVYTSTNAASKMAAFEVPAVSNGAKAVHQLQIALGATKTISGGVATTWFSKQQFIDLNGKLANGIEDSQATAKYENTGSSDFYINA